jgi:hypothetical protein
MVVYHQRSKNKSSITPWQRKLRGHHGHHHHYQQQQQQLKQYHNPRHASVQKLSSGVPYYLIPSCKPEPFHPEIVPPLIN